MMSTCERWIAITDLEAVGDPISDDDLRFKRQHRETCASCARESAAWRALAEEPAEPLRHGADDVDRIVAEFRAEERALVRVAPGRWRSARNAAGMSALLVAACVLFFALGRTHGSRVAADPVTAHAEVATIEGELVLDGKRANVGDAVNEGSTLVAHGRACVRIEGGVLTCLGARSEASFTDAAFAHRVVELRRGQLESSLSHQTPGSTFSVSTREGSVTAVGTAFSVTVDEALVAVRVQEGIVAIGLASGGEQRLGAGEGLTLGATSPPQTPSAFSNGDAVSPQPPSIDEAVSSPVASSSARPMGTSSVAPAISAARLLDEARTRRLSGDFRGTMEAYQRLEAEFPESAEAHASLMSLGQLQLAQFGDAAAALRAFDAYLRKGGTLSQEAELGRIDALRSLGRRSDEKAAIDAFLSRYPSTLQADALRVRARDLGSLL